MASGPVDPFKLTRADRVVVDPGIDGDVFFDRVVFQFAFERFEFGMLRISGDSQRVFHIGKKFETTIDGPVARNGVAEYSEYSASVPFTDWAENFGFWLMSMRHLSVARVGM